MKKRAVRLAVICCLLSVEAVTAVEFRPRRVNLVDDPFEPDVLSSQVSPDGEWLVWIQGDPFLQRLYSARRWDGSPAVPLTTQLVGERGILDFQISPDSRWVVYRGETAGTSRVELWVVPISGGSSPRRLNEFATGDFQVQDVTLSPSGPRAVFLSNQRVAVVSELWSALLDGSEPATTLHPAQLSGDGVLSGYQLSPAGDSVVFVREIADGEPTDLWSASIDGAVSTQLSATGSSLGSVDELHLTPDGVRAVYQQAADAPWSQYDVWSVRVDGSTAANLITGSPQTWDVKPGIWVDPTSQTVAFVADVDADARRELWAADIVNGGPPLLLVETEFPGGGVDRLEFGLDGSRLAFSNSAVFAVSLAAPGTVTRLSPIPSHGGGVNVGHLSVEAGDRVVFSGDFHEPVRADLYSAPIDGSEAAGRLDPLAPDGRLQDIGTTSPGTHAVFVDAELSNGTIDLWSARSDGQNSPIRLTPSRPPGGNFSGFFYLDPTGARVVYPADLEGDGEFSFYAVEIGGPAQSSVSISGDPATEGALLGWDAFTPEGLGGLFRADQDGVDGYELWLTDSMIFIADHEESDLSEWSLAVGAP